tara:strand:- start:6252 stop:6860 length:609 start_codon:yes stop_codon:yes gene_type:complete
MATAYTEDIENGITFKEYAYSCARSFGALASMRDEPGDADIPEEFEVDSYHLDEIERYKKELEILESMSMEEVILKAKKRFEDEVKYNKDRIIKKDKLREKYNQMIMYASKYTPPTDQHVEFKNFMISQLVTSIEYDCDTSYQQRALETEKQQTGEEWLKRHIQDAKKSIRYHDKAYDRALQGLHSKNEWLKLLRESIEAVK